MTLDEEWEALAVMLRLQGETYLGPWSEFATSEVRRLYEKEGVGREAGEGFTIRDRKFNVRLGRIWRLKKALWPEEITQWEEDRGWISQK